MNEQTIDVLAALSPSSDDQVMFSTRTSCRTGILTWHIDRTSYGLVWKRECRITDPA